MDKYDLKERLGVGSFGVVYKAWDFVYVTRSPLIYYSVNRTNDEIVAIKIIGERIHQKKVYLANISKDLEQTDEDILHIQQEIQHLAACQSDYVTKYYASFVDGFKLWIGWSSYQFED
ncbi:hypothetical protein E3Q18_00718 [Wallemia mellicola]|nr:hypothetical protein E3Q19_01190 [Wallemia mellicola]TIC01420.1 hypothetical protein E3Q18_00718 [Wallemia mellicola]